MELSLQDAFLDISAVSATFTPSDMRRMGQDRGNVLLPTSYGDSFWFGSVTIAPKRHGDMERIESRFFELLEADGSFMICPPARMKADEVNGSILAIDANDRRIIQATNISGLSEGDWLGVNYAGGKRGLHKIRTATGNSLRVVPALALGVNVSDVTTYGRPSIRAIVDAGSYQGPTYQAAIATGISFSWTQTLRADA